ncbi:Protein Lines-1 [Galemys pyrenaicus]|uniref:Protein Lines-1 n=1 Tax=Galemys pyrenaicus TaxID=202257 RepID=A0A8J6DS60_GALPY|nr:Protein Lines-1 [Galemys pyrenaicus]
MAVKMEACFEFLEQLYQKVLRGTTLEDDSCDYALYLSPAFSDQAASSTACSEGPDTPGVLGGRPPASASLASRTSVPECLKRNAQQSSVWEIRLLQLTVIRVMTARALSWDTDRHAKEQYQDVIKILLKSSEVESELTGMSHEADKLLPHMAAKCLALLVYFRLREEHFENFQDTSKIVTSLMSFLELLELLIATRILLKSHFTCQRLLFLKPSCVLDVITWPIQAFVKRKCITFIKKCLLQKVGEDLCHSSVPAFTLQDPHFNADMLALADAILQAVDLGLLRALSVRGKPSCFGGDEVQLGCVQVPGADHVLLRAASLLVIKSLEIKFQSCASVNEMKVDLQRFMSELLTFLKPHLQPSLPSCNPCEWLSRVFIEQDDDMLEAAKASMGVYVKLTRLSLIWDLHYLYFRDCETTESLTQEKELWKCHTHDHGYNPHCIFLFFLRNIGFDSTLLLDFLISSETCFLEYFVRYLKLLQKDWDNFFTICKYFDVTELKDNIDFCGCAPFLVADRNSNQPEPDSLAAAESQRNAPSWVSPASPEPLCQVVMSKKTHTTLKGGRWSPPKTSQSLVDYDSSEDSEVESTDRPLANSKQTSVHQEAKRKVQDTCEKGRNEKGLSLEPHSRPLVPKDSNAPFSVLCDVATESTVSEASSRTARCFGELQDAIQRLQKKNLFPYNPTALLKLLKHIEAIYNKSVSSL